MSIAAPTDRHAPVGVPRSLVIADAWAQLADVEPFTGRTGLPLARTVKLLLDPLVLRPMQNPRLAAALLPVETAAELRALILDAAHDLAAAAAWFLLLKQARRRARITTGNPQDLYFQRAYELARGNGAPGPDAEALIAEALAEIHDATRVTVVQLREHVSDPRVGARLRLDIERAWRAADRSPRAVPHEAVVRLLDRCAEGGAADTFEMLVETASGSAGATDLEADGVAQRLGLTDRVRLRPPELGASASKSTLPPPLDRSILERLFASFAAVVDSGGEVGEVVQAEILRSAGGWQLAHEPSRVLLLAASHATESLPTAPDDLGEGAERVRTDAARRMRARWEREPFVRRALRLADANAETVHVREAVMRRLWARLHGRELRDEPVVAADAWALLDGALRSVILDRRGRVKASIAREAVGGAA